MKIRGWEFYLGAILTAIAAIAVIAAVFDVEWRGIMSKIGASIAVFAVTGAALIAYDGATQTLKHNRRVYERDEIRRQLVAALKLEIGSHAVRNDATGIIDRLLQHAGMWTTQTPLGYRIETPKEIEDTLELLDALPEECVEKMRVLKLAILQYQRAYEAYQLMEDKTNEYARLFVHDEMVLPAKRIRSAATDLAEATQSITARCRVRWSKFHLQS